VRPYRALLLVAGFFLIISTSVSLSLPLVARSALDKVLKTQQIGAMDQLALGMLALILLASLLGFAEHMLIAYMGNRIVMDMRSRLFAHLQRLPVAFFDRAQVVNRLGKAKAKMLSLSGRDIRQEGRKLLGPKSKSTTPRPPGKPPKTHVDEEHWATLRRILYHASRDDSVIIGPVKANQVQQNAVDLGTLTVPEIQEEGAEVDIREESLDHGRTWRRRDMRRGTKPWKRYRTRRATYPARPFMKPALARVFERYRKKGKYPGLQIGPTSSVQVGPPAEPRS
jgi:hypothetical protein